MHGWTGLERLLKFSRWSVLSFVVLSLASMLFYPGGTYRDRTSVGYRFFSNFLSDLGMPHSWNGDSNPWGAPLFLSGEALLAVGLVAFFVGFVRVSSSVPDGRGWSRAAAVACTIVALAIVTAGATPANRFQWLHLEAAKTAFRAACFATAFLSVVVVRDERFSRLAAIVSILLPVMLAVYVGILEWGPRATASDYGLTFQVTAQKIIVAVVLPAVFFLSQEAAARERRISRLVASAADAARAARS